MIVFGFLSLIWYIVPVLVLGHPTSGLDAKNPSPSTPHSALESIRTTYHLPGLVAVRIPDGLSESQSARVVGVRKQGNTTLLTTRDKFHVGSLTKAMTSTLIAMLINDITIGLTWDTTIPQAFPHISNISAGHVNTTLAMLGAHFGGLNDTFLFEREPEVWITVKNGSVTPAAGRKLVVEKALSYPPVTTPGTSFLYSNVEYILLGHLLDTHWCGSWEDSIHQRLWRPLGMRGCGFGTPPEPTLQSIDNPWPHQPGNPDPIPVIPDQQSDNPPTLGPAGTVHCDIPSYANFLRLHLDGLAGRDTRVLPAAAFARLHRPYLEVNGDSNGSVAESYTPGAWIVAGPDERVNGTYLWHDGSNGVNYAYGVLAPGMGEAYFTATNVGGEAAREGGNEVLVGFFDGSLGSK